MLQVRKGDSVSLCLSPPKCPSSSAVQVLSHTRNGLTQSQGQVPSPGNNPCHEHVLSSLPRLGHTWQDLPRGLRHRQSHAPGVGRLFGLALQLREKIPVPGLGAPSLPLPYRPAGVVTCCRSVAVQHNPPISAAVTGARCPWVAGMLLSQRPGVC